MKHKIIVLNLVLLAGFSMTAIAGNVWITNYEEAKKAAVARHLPILAYFSGSDWSNDCLRFDTIVLQSKVFQEFASPNLVLLQIDFPRKKSLPEDIKKQNNKLLQYYGISIYPSVLLLNSEGKIIAIKNYDKGDPALYVEELRKLIGK